jgi:hypothetical protein
VSFEELIGAAGGNLKRRIVRHFAAGGHPELAAFRKVIAHREDTVMKAQQPYRPRHSGYVSEFEDFLNTYVHRHPAVEKDQQTGWYLLWDKHVDLGELNKERADTVPFKSYYYD